MDGEWGRELIDVVVDEDLYKILVLGCMGFMVGILYRSFLGLPVNA
jgi:hypothetical protein